MLSSCIWRRISRNICNTTVSRSVRRQQETTLLISSSSFKLINNSKMSTISVASSEFAPAEETSLKRKVASSDGEVVEDERCDDDNDNTDDEGEAQTSKKKKSKWKNRRKVVQNNISWKEDNNQVNAGSFAHPEQQKLYNIELPTKPDNVPKTTKKKVSFLLGYLGTNYAGFQMNEGQRSLQAELELALLKSGLVSFENFGFPSKYGWSTSGRTDKGVHACAQVVSLKVELLPDQTMDQVRDSMNQALPSDIRVLDAVRTTRSFCAKTQRDRVRYQYMIPSFVFTSNEKLRHLFETNGCHTNGRPAYDPLSVEEVSKIQSEIMKSARVTPQQLQTLKEALRLFVGTHSFHNFSRRVTAEEARAKRFIVSFETEDPVVFDGVEWIPTQVLGQSFMLNQIRKMVSLAMDVARGVAPVCTITKALQQSSDIRIAPAPAQNLYLEMSYYDNYNKRKNEGNSDVADLDWHEESSAAYQRWKDFRNGVVMKHVVEEEAREGNFIKHLFAQEYIFDYQRFYQLDGTTTLKEEEVISEE